MFGGEFTAAAPLPPLAALFADPDPVDERGDGDSASGVSESAADNDWDWDCDCGDPAMALNEELESEFALLLNAPSCSC